MTYNIAFMVAWCASLYPKCADCGWVGAANHDCIFKKV